MATQSSCIEAATREYISTIPDVVQVVTPLALDMLYDPLKEYDQPSIATTYMETRSFILRAKCRYCTVGHIYFLGLATDPSEEMTPLGAERIARLLNDQKIVMSINTPLGRCDAPFSHTTLMDNMEHNTKLKIEGLSYHCHCTSQFSEQCWRAVFAAAERIAAVCKELRASKSRVEEVML
ncbi:nuclear protein UL55 [Columbid alphaherpesvirus 1]|uniref:Nuclear protein UL55 n=1 Tax=Columbid alphaherpesvirus 1 TaxID=93386 RepID=A0A1V0M8K6_9ALPH|nr:nuclear protein UL55 [Columbid alphaherpesvirus 1]ARD71384.1 nuclear protein UL55 [Columbid alphaherpesvirus 1]